MLADTIPRMKIVNTKWFILVFSPFTLFSVHNLSGDLCELLVKIFSYLYTNPSLLETPLPETLLPETPLLEGSLLETSYEKKQD